MLQFFRAPALSEVKTDLLLQEIKAAAPGILGLTTETAYYVDVGDKFSEQESDGLDYLISETYEPEKFRTESSLANCNRVIEVGPRLSLVTPWSTSAGTIFRACNFSNLNRIKQSRRYGFFVQYDQVVTSDEWGMIKRLLYDKMTEEVYEDPSAVFAAGARPAPVRTIPLIEEGKSALTKFAQEYGLSFTPAMEDYIYEYFVHVLKRNPTDVVLFMFGQLNSEHCRHHIFNGRFIIDGKTMSQTMMDMVRETLRTNPGNLAVALQDNAAVLMPVPVQALLPSAADIASDFRVVTIFRGFALKVETHNHPTTVSPRAGAETGMAVRRDIFGVRRGGVSTGHLAGYYVGHLFVPGYALPWEKKIIGYSPRFATPLQILIEASNGASDNANCFGNPVVLGTARSFEQVIDHKHYGYRKTAMVAGSFGYVDGRHLTKQTPAAGMLIVQTGGPAFPIGVGGGSGSSQEAGSQGSDLDFNSVQRGDAFTERGNFNVIRACSELGDDNPIVTENDLGAGGDCVAIPELVFPGGAKVELRRIPCGDESMPDLVYWGNESQERMVYIIHQDRLALFSRICVRHRCTMAIIGEVRDDGKFILIDRAAPADAPPEQATPIDVGMDWLLADLPQREIVCASSKRRLSKPRIPDRPLVDHLERVFHLLDVGSKEFLTKKSDRTVGNRTVRQQEVGPLQIPLADCAVMSDGPFGTTGNIIALGEQPIKGLINNAAGIRMSIGEAITNAIWAPMNSLSDLSFSATWQWPGGQEGEDARLYQAVAAARACIIELLTRIGVGKDSLSMNLKEVDAQGNSHSILAPGTVQMVAYGPCCDINNVITPDIKMPGQSRLMFVDLAKGAQRLGGSALLRVYDQLGDESPDLDDAKFFRKAFMAVQGLIRSGLILSGHDRSDGALITCVSEMAFAGNCGVKLNLRGVRLGGYSQNKALFNEELGLVFEFLPKHQATIHRALREAGVAKHCHVIGETITADKINVKYYGNQILDEKMSDLRALWRETSSRLDERQAVPAIVRKERSHIYKRSQPKWSLSFEPQPTSQLSMMSLTKPRAAVLSEAGTNGDRDAAEALYLAGFQPVEVLKQDLISGQASLKDCQLLFLPGGFSFRDTFGAGKGGAAVFKFNERAAAELAAFVERPDTLVFGVCNGCQELPLLGLLPWPGISPEKLPRFIRNASERFEHRLVTIRIFSGSQSVFLKGMAGSVLGIIVAHGEGRCHCPDKGILDTIIRERLAPIRYADDEGNTTEAYPFNPNGSDHGIAGLSSRNGRILAMMPHFERLPLNNLWPWQPLAWKKLKASPGLKIFQNAREWCEQSRMS